DAQAHVRHCAILEPEACERHAERKIASAAAELAEAGARVGWQNRQLDCSQKLVVSARSGHDAFEEIAGLDSPYARTAAQHNTGIGRRSAHAPSRCGIGRRDAATKRPAGADRVMRDVAHHGGEELAEGPLHYWAIEGSVAHAGADREPAVFCAD